MPETPINRENPDKPLGALDTNQYTYSNFIYPLDLASPGTGSDHYMVFYINETSRTEFATRTVRGAQPTDQAAKTVNKQADAARQGKAAAGSANANDPNGTGTKGANGETLSPGQIEMLKQPIRRVATTIVLYTPGGISTNYSADWEAMDLGLGKDFMAAATGNGSLTDFFKSAGVSGIANAGQMANELTGMALNQAISATTRMAINNHSEVIFNGIGFRKFSFRFRFTPTSEEEAINIDNIIRAFKFYAAPEILSGTAGRFWIYPAEFDIQYHSNGKENLYLNKISTCALTDISIDYTPMGHWAGHRPTQASNSRIQGSPSVCTDMTLQFTELELITKRLVSEGY